MGLVGLISSVCERQRERVRERYKIRKVEGCISYKNRISFSISNRRVHEQYETRLIRTFLLLMYDDEEESLRA